jgi:hypothetical protein
MGMIVPGGITGPCSGGGAGLGLGIGIGEFVGMTGGPCAGVIEPAPGGGPRGCGGAYCASGMGIVGVINCGAIWLAAAPSDDTGYWSRSRGRLLKRPRRRVLRGRTLLYVVGCCGWGSCWGMLAVPPIPQELYCALGSWVRRGRKGVLERTSLGGRGRGLCP